MQSTSPPALHPAMLLPGTRVGPWRVVAWAGCGMNGAVYRAVPVGSEHASPVALKIALCPSDPRFAREVELLSRTHHPSVPRLVDSGTWQHPDGTCYPFIVTEWVEGMPLYDWARQNPPTVPQVLELLAQLAGALSALHAHGGVHRDVKGGNVLVRHSDGRAMLTDFGTGRYLGVVTLTPPGAYPGTPAYRSPEVALCELQSLSDPSAHHPAGPADDIYALGVTACRLVTGEYPQFTDPWKDEHGIWHLDSVLPPKLLHIEPRLRDLILRMLSMRPAERGTAEQIAEALKQAVESSLSQSSPPPSVRSPNATRTLLWTAAMGLVLMAWMGWRASREPTKERATARAETARTGQKDAGPTALGEAATTTSMEVPPNIPAQEVMAEDTLPKPQPGQVVPDAKGRCPHLQLVALNGGCWGMVSKEPEMCEILGGQMFKGSCYIPIFPHSRGHPRLPTSGPTRRSAPR
jgi:serine/threonine protein kinase